MGPAGFGAVLLVLLASRPGVAWDPQRLDLDQYKQQILSSFNSFKDGPLRKISPFVKDAEASVVDWAENTRTRLGDTLEDTRARLGDTLEDTRRTLHSVRDETGRLYSQVEDQMQDGLKQLGQSWDRLGRRAGQEWVQVGSRMDEFGHQLDHNIRRGFTNFGNFDMFGPSILSEFRMPGLGNGFLESFGFQQARPWWQGDNVCVKREVVEEEDSLPGLDIQSTGNLNVHMQVNQCVEGVDQYECTNTVTEEGALKTFKQTYRCCHGFARSGRADCSAVDTQPLEETLASMEGVEFLSLLAEHGLDTLLDNVTVFLPDDEAVADFVRELEELDEFDEQSMNVVYNIDDGLVNKRKKRNIQIVEQPEVAAVLAGHIVPGFLAASQLENNAQLASANRAQDAVRISVYPTRPRPTIMANCARITAKDTQASNGIVHMVDKVLVPAKDTIADILSADLQFKTFMNALEQNDLASDLAKEGDFTVFAPTDEAFEKLDSITAQKVLGSGGCARDIIQSHILNNVVCSGIVENRVKVTNAGGRDMLLQRDESGNIAVEGVTLMMKDKLAANGVIHVIEDVIIQESVKSVLDHLKERRAERLLELVEAAGLTKTLDTLTNLTLFAPSERALSELPGPVLAELKGDRKRLEELLLHHVAAGSVTKCQMQDNTHLATATDTTLRVNLHKHFGHLRPLATVQCARLIQEDEAVCGGRVHTIDTVLTPPAGHILHTIQQSHPRFAELVGVAGLEAELGTGLHTLLAPTDSAFTKLGADIASRLGERATAEAVVRAHMLDNVLCCAAVPPVSGFFHLNIGRRSSLGESVSIRRSHAGHIYANQAAITRCDVAATNGVVHSVDRVLVPASLQDQQTRRNSFW